MSHLTIPTPEQFFSGKVPVDIGADLWMLIKEQSADDADLTGRDPLRPGFVRVDEAAPGTYAQDDCLCPASEISFEDALIAAIDEHYAVNGTSVHFGKIISIEPEISTYRDPDMNEWFEQARCEEYEEAYGHLQDELDIPAPPKKPRYVRVPFGIDEDRRRNPDKFRNLAPSREIGYRPGEYYYDATGRRQTRELPHHLFDWIQGSSYEPGPDRRDLTDAEKRLNPQKSHFGVSSSLSSKWLPPVWGWYGDIEPSINSYFIEVDKVGHSAYTRKMRERKQRARVRDLHRRKVMQYRDREHDSIDLSYPDQDEAMLCYHEAEIEIEAMMAVDWDWFWNMKCEEYEHEYGRIVDREINDADQWVYFQDWPYAVCFDSEVSKCFKRCWLEGEDAYEAGRILDWKFPWLYQDENDQYEDDWEFSGVDQPKEEEEDNSASTGGYEHESPQEDPDLWWEFVDDDNIVGRACVTPGTEQWTLRNKADYGDFTEDQTRMFPHTLHSKERRRAQRDRERERLMLLRLMIEASIPPLHYVSAA